jgi:ribosomal protein L24
MLIDPETDLPTRVGIRVDDSGHKVRYAKRSGRDID